MILISSSRLKSIGVCFAILFSTLQATPVTANFILRMQTDLGAIDVEMFDTVAPLTVANFMNYVNDSDYDGTFFHRSIPGFVVQGGGFIADTPNGSILTDGASLIPTDPPVVNEFNLSNLRGTIAMAKVGGDPDSATSQWFFNLADNSANLDNQNGGFTVFAQVLGDGMEVVDSMAALQRCTDIAFIPGLCGSFPEVPFAPSDGDAFTNNGLINISYIGVDSEGDGVIDRVEDAAPNGGDGNNDTVLDSTQQFVASFSGESGGYVTTETSSLTPFKSFNVLGTTYARTTSDLSGLITDRDFENGYFSFELLNVVPGDNVVTVTLPEGSLPDQFFNYGPTPDDNTPHWYEFDFDGTTGAEINANVIRLHFADGLRGDSDLALNGTIKAAVGGAATITGDGDGVADDVEDGAPNKGDGNSDGLPDKQQANVSSLLDAVSGEYITIEAESSMGLKNIGITDGSNIIAQSVTGNELNGLNFTHGFIRFEVLGVTPGTDVSVKLFMNSTKRPVKFFKFGPTPDNPVDHFYEFDFDGETGAEFNGNVITLHFVDGKRGDADLTAEFNGNVITLHFVDGKRGDADLTANGIIVDPGTPAIKAVNTGSSSGGSSGGGCSINPSENHPGRAVGWLLIGLFILLLGAYRKAYRH